MADEPTEPATGTEPPAPPQETPPAPEPATGEPEPAQPAATDGSAAAAEEAARWKALARKHEDQNKATRTELAKVQSALDTDRSERQKQMDALAVALGLKSGDEPPDPAKLAADLQAAREQATARATELEREIRQRDIRLAVLTQAPSHDANGALLMDSMSFLRTVEALDPSAGDFSEQLGEAIRTAAEANAQYKLTPPKPEPKAPPSPARSGGEFNGAPGGNRQWTLDDVRAASPAQVVEAQNQGLLQNLGYSPKKTAR